MPSTYTPINTNTVSGTSTTSITFSSVPSTYTDLILVGSVALSADNPVALELNSDTGSNYSITQLYGVSSSAASFRESNQSVQNVWYLQTTPSTNALHFQNYSNTTNNKTVLMRGGSSDLVRTGVVLWRNTAAISNIKLTTGGGYFIAGSTFTLYGIKAA
jgi:hypothetical protein